MSVSNLQKERWESFSRLITAGMKPGEAYVQAGFESKDQKVARTSASKLLKKQWVMERIAELKVERAGAVAREVNEAIATVGAIDQDVMSRIGRAKALAVRRSKILQIFEERGKDPAHIIFAGGTTGFLAITEKQIGSDRVKIASVDTKTLSELRATEEQIARELGQWVEKRDDTMTVKSLADLPEEAVRQIIEDAERLLSQAPQSALNAPESDITTVHLERVTEGHFAPF